MARKINDLFIGPEYLSLEGRTIKHPALINVYGSINVNKVSNKPLTFVGVDIETDVNDGSMKLIGFYMGGQLIQYTDNFLVRLFHIVKWAERKKMNFAYWNKLDPFQIFKLFLLQVDEYEQRNSLKRYGKTGGVWDYELCKWDDESPPVIKVNIGTYEFGIQTVIRSAIKFYIKSKTAKSPRFIWAYDIATLYQYGIEREALGKYDASTDSYPNARLPYYSKVDISAHIVDWDKYNVDDDYKKLVNKSNYLDARAAHDLADHFQKDFYKAFGYYPRTLISAGSIARASIVAVLLNKYGASLPSKKENIPKTPAYNKAFDDINSISLINYFDEWLTKFGADTVKNVFSITTEAYKGGYIEALEFGFVEKAWYADLSSAYPAFIQQLKDLRGANITHGVGDPPSIPNSYCFIRGDVNIPNHVNIHPLTIKHPVSKDTNIRAVGHYRASYLKEERDYLIELGATFENEEWYNIETLGKLSPLAHVSKELGDLRTYFINQGDTAEYIAKASNNSLYGVGFEATNTHYEVPFFYKQKDVRMIIESALDIFGTRDYDLYMNTSDINELVDTTIGLLTDKSPFETVTTIMVTDFIENIYSKNTVFDDRYSVLRSYIKKINLEPIKSDLKHHFDDEYRLHYNRFHKKDGIYYDDFLNELEFFGIYFDSNLSNVDKVIQMMLLYAKLKNENESKNIIEIDNIFSIVELDELKRNLKDFFLDELSLISNIDIMPHGYRAGEFFNPLYASWITSQTRILLSKAANNIADNGGKVLSLLTDSIFWEGSSDMLSPEYWREVKTTGTFEKPAMVENFLSLGAGRYEYFENGKYVSKKRGLNTTDWHSTDGLDRTDTFSWHKALTNPDYQTSDGKLKINVRTLVSVGMVANSRKRIEDGQIKGYDVNDLGMIINQTREVDAIIGISKRFISTGIDLELLSKQTFATRPIEINRFIFGKDKIVDQTLPELRKLMMEITPETSRERRRKVSAKSSAKYYTKNRDAILEDYRAKYNALRSAGYSRNVSRQFAVYSYSRLLNELNINVKVSKNINIERE